MKEPICECYYDAALHHQSTGCRLHDPYDRCIYLEQCIDKMENVTAALEAQLAEARKAIVSAINILECEYGYSMAKGNFPMLYAAIEAVGKESER